MRTEDQLNLTHEQLVETLDYDPSDGMFRWKIPPCNRIKKGAVAGHKNRMGYWAVEIARRSYPAHRLAWFYVNEEWPDRQISHLNGNNLDNRLENLAIIESDAPNRMALTVERLREIIHYNERTGEFTNIGNRSARSSDGEPAGFFRKDGYYAIGVDGVHHLGHRLAWFYVHGRWPAEMIDHINGDRGDNRLVNLREAKGWQNSANAPARSTSGTGIKGVSYDARKKKFTARVMVQSRFYNLGYFSSKEDAAEAIAKLHKEHQGDFAHSKLN